jgi:striatin 1/3/4
VIRVWTIPPFELDTYEKHGVAIDYLVRTMEGHTDAIWSISHHPHLPHILSASSDATVRLWDHERPSPLLQTFTFPDKTPHIPTSATTILTDPHQCIASYNSASLAVFDMEKGSCVLSHSPSGSTIDPSTQINTVITHPTLSLAITAHEDKKIEFFDLKSGKVIHSMVGHLDSVSTLDIDPSGLYLLSAGHDSSARFWDINTRTCIQEINVSIFLLRHLECT